MSLLVRGTSCRPHLQPVPGENPLPRPRPEPVPEKILHRDTVPRPSGNKNAPGAGFRPILRQFVILQPRHPVNTPNFASSQFNPSFPLMANPSAAELSALITRAAEDNLPGFTIAGKVAAVQFAADALWPYTDELTRPIRTAFKIPTNCPLTI